jgi:hypothetical protein
MRTHQLLQLLTVLVLWAGAAWVSGLVWVSAVWAVSATDVFHLQGEEQPRSYEDLIALSKCSPKCFEFGSCNEELGRCDCIKGRQGPDCSEVGSACGEGLVENRSIDPAMKTCIQPFFDSKGLWLGH